VFGVCGWKNNGKTTLTARLVTEFVNRGLRVSTVKHAHHLVDVDRPGTDSFKHREAGAQEVLLAGGQRYAVMHEYRDHEPLEADQLVDRLSPCDLVLVEGFKYAAHPKVEVHRSDAAHDLIARTDSQVVAVASDSAIDTLGRPRFALDDIPSIADFIWEYVP
jgi:molybdopterin-guanine dinucleotide biosynthesis protein B